MNLIRELSELPDGLRGGAVAIGNFDGVHRGHARIVERLIKRAGEERGPAVVFTFDPHPVRLLRPDAAPPPLTWTERKAVLLSALGVDAVIAFPTDERLLAMQPRAFFDDVIQRRLAARALVEGPNFYFGKDREGDVELLARYCEEAGIRLDVVEPLIVGEAYVSSSRVRDCIRRGKAAEADELLTQPYRIRGMVTHGSRRGGKIGFPTANIEAIDTLLPADGVYAGRAHASGEAFAAAINIGPCPTFGEHIHKVEAHLIGYSGSLYGAPLEVEFLDRLRATRPFETVEDLKTQLAADATAAEKIARASA